MDHKQTKKDLATTLILTGICIIAMIVLYYYDQQSHILSSITSSWLK